MASRAHGDQLRVTGDVTCVTGAAWTAATALQQRRTNPLMATDRDATGDASHWRDTTAVTGRSSVILLDPRSVRAQRAGRYLAGTAAHPTRLAPDLAAALIHIYSEPADLVLDPLAGTGTVLVEAIHLGRSALGVTDDPGWVAIGRANLALATRQGAPGRARILAADATRLPARVPAKLHGQVALVLTSPPPAASLGLTTVRRRPEGAADLRRRRTAMVDGLSATLAGCLPLLTPCGIVVVVGRPWYRGSALTDQSMQISHAAQLAGLTLIACHRAVPAAQPDRSGGGETGGTRVTPRVAVRHHDVAVFQARRLAPEVGHD